MIPPNWIQANDLDSWAKTRNSQERLPELLRRLIHATVPFLQRIGFPAGESVQMGGWDGIVETIEGNAFVPNGCSVWELGTNRDVKTKADKDYQKRCNDSLGLNPANTTFIFVTPRRWGSKNKWIRDKQAEGVWAEVIAYDADDIEQWLELAPAVHTWLARLLGKWSENTQDLGSFWDEWINATSPKLSSALHLDSREQNVERVKNWLNDPPSILTIQADSYEEAIAFFAAILYDISENDRVKYLSRCVLVKNDFSWRDLASSQDSLIMIPTFNRPNSIPRKHHVLIPIGREISPSQDSLRLSRLSRDGFRQSLLNMGVSRERTDILYKDSKCSVLVLRRLLASHPEIHTPHWATPENAPSLIPVLLAGAWDETKEADREIIGKIACKPYAEFIANISRWLNTSDPPIRKIGDIWQLVSREVTWHFLSGFLVSEDINALETTVRSVLGTLDPKYELPVEKQAAACIYGKELPYSEFLRKGLAETLALLSTKGLPLVLQHRRTVQGQVNTTIRQLLSLDSDWKKWASLSSALPTLAEAAPEVFLEAVEQGIEGESPTLLGLFQESWTGSSPHTDLLWALEALAWETNYLSRVSLILAKLSKLDPGGRILNRPFNSLREIFLCWNPQTLASLEQRLRIIDLLLSSEPVVTWKLMCSLLPSMTRGISHPTYKPCWRDWIVGSNAKVTWAEYYQNIDALMQRILSNVGRDTDKLCDVISCIESLPVKQQNLTLEFLELIKNNNIQDTDLSILDNTFRELIYKHKQHASARWAMSATTLEKLEAISQKFEPQDFILRYSWLFSFNPKLLELEGLDWQSRDKKIKEIQIKTAKKVYFEFGISGLLDLAVRVQQAGLLGAAVARIETITENEIELLKKFIGQDKKALSNFAFGFVRCRVEVSGWDWAEALVHLAKSEQWSNEKIIDFFLCLPLEQHSWNLLSLFDKALEINYWKNLTVCWVRAEDCETVIGKLLSVNRPHTALNLAALHLYDQPKASSIHPRTLIKVLEQLSSIDPSQETPEPDTTCFHSNIDKIFSVLDISESVEEQEIARLEWIYFYVLRHSSRQPKILYQELSRNPLFFAELIKLAYRGEKDRKNQSLKLDKAMIERARMSDELLEEWNQIPGLTQEGQVNATQLRSWVLDARVACHDSGRGKIGDQIIGKILAYSPKAIDGIWPDLVVREVIEEVASRDLELGIKIGIYNKRGVWTKEIGEGGIQERQMAEIYRNYATAVVYTYPRTASMLRSIADGYESDAHQEDIRSELEYY